MEVKVEYLNKSYNCDLRTPIDISIPLGQVRCFSATKFKTEPYKKGDFVGSVKAGAPVNFYDITISPHGNGTHTECLGHITKAQESINDQLLHYHFIAQVISIPLEIQSNGDQVVSLNQLRKACPSSLPPALVIRTMPNQTSKLTKEYSGTNPPYIEEPAMSFIVEKNVQHLLIDLPSVDREEDEGRIIGHRLFWHVKNGAPVDDSRSNCTITELIFIPDEVEDGLYLLNIQIPSINLDATPSKPVIYKLYDEK